MKTKNLISVFIVISLISGMLTNSVFAMTEEHEGETFSSSNNLQDKLSSFPEKTSPPIFPPSSLSDNNLIHTSGYPDEFRLIPQVNSSIDSPVPVRNDFDYGSIITDLTHGVVQGSSPWQQINKDGFEGNNFQIPSLQEFNGDLYAGTWKNFDEVISAEVWRTVDSGGWEKVDERAHNGCADMIVFDTYLYCGSWDGVIWRTVDGTSWTEVVTDGFGDSNNGIARFAVFGSMLYAGTWNSNGTQIWRTSNGTNWTKFGDGLDPSDIAVGAISTEEFGGYLYWGLANWDTGAQLWRTDGTTLTQMTTGTSPAISSLAAFDGYLYAGVWDATSTQVWRSANGSDWTQMVTFSDLDSAIREANGLEVYDGVLYLVGANPDNGLEVWRTGNGSDWEQVGYAGFGDASNGLSFWDNAITTFGGKLIIATNNFETGGEVWTYEPNDSEVYDVRIWLNLGVKDWIGGHARPGLDVTITTPRDTIETYADPNCNGCFDIKDPIEINAGDLITVTAGEALYPVEFTLPTPLLSNADSLNEEVWGQIGGRSGDLVQVNGFWEDGYQEVTTDSEGNFSIFYPDIPRGGDGYIRFSTVVDEADISIDQYFKTPDLVMDIYPFADLIEGQYAPGHTIMLTVKDSNDDLKAVATVTTGEIDWWDGRTGFATQIDDAYWNPSKPDIVPGDKIYGAVDGGTYQAYAQVGEITGEVDIDSDSISGTIDAGWLIPDPGEVIVECYPWGSPGGAPDKYSSVIPDGDPAHSYTCAWDPGNEWDVQKNQWIGVGYRDLQNNRVIEEFYEADYNLYLNVNYGHDWIEISYPPGYNGTFTVTESDGTTVKATVDFTTTTVPWWGGDTGFSTNLEGVVWDPERPDFQTGDWVFGEIDVDGTLYYAEVQLGEITGEVDVDSDSITGTIDVPWLPQEEKIFVWCHTWGAPPDTEGKGDFVFPDGEDTYNCAWDPDTEWDIQPGQDIGVSYSDSENQTVLNAFVGYTDELILHVQYDHDWIQGLYEPDHTVFLQVIDQEGLEKAHITLPTGYWPDFGNQSGFVTHQEGANWIPSQPDIQPGDTIHGEVDDGSQFTADVQIGWVTADLSLDNDQVSGTVAADWLPQQEDVRVGCYIWDNNAPQNQEDWVLPDGDDTYLCDWTDDGYDLNETSNLMVAYFDPAGHELIGDFRPPAPRLRIEKWLENGEPGEGGNVTFNIQYRNEGDDTALNAIITDTLVQGLTYLGDTSGLPKTVVGNQVIWQLGDLAPGDWVNFYVFAHVDGIAGSDVINTAEISSDSFDAGNPEDRVRTAQNTVVANNTHVNVGKGTWTWNPAPGQNFVYNVNVCNNGSTGSTELTLTETLPAAVTFDSWWGREAGWEEISIIDNVLTFEYPTIAGGSCREVFVKVNLDENAQPGQELVNFAEISAENDDPDEMDNQTELHHNVGQPNVDLGIGMGWHWGSLVPGGYYRFGIKFYNQGNLSIEGPITITVTLPDGTSFVGWDHWDWASFLGEPVVDGNTITWLVDDLDPGYYGTIEVFVDIDPSTSPGTELLHTAEIGAQDGEGYLENNTASLTETVYEHGPNLRISKEGDWHGHGEGHNAWYQLRVENVGDQGVSDILVTDHYPTQMLLDGGVNVGYWKEWQWQDFPAEHYFTVLLDNLPPGANMEINYNVVIPGSDPVPEGQIFTNTAHVSEDPAETYPEDNTSLYLLGSGPDMFVDKQLIQGELHPGEEVTYLLEFGNAQPGHTWWWNMDGNAILVDTLPDGMTFVSSYWHCYQETEWCEMTPTIVGQELTWKAWPLSAGERQAMVVTVRLSEDLQNGAELVNLFEISSDQPADDLDPFPDNNSETHTGTVEVPIQHLYLPLILR